MPEKKYPLLVKGPSTKGEVSDTWTWALIDVDKEGREWVTKIRFHGQPIGSKVDFGKRPKEWIQKQMSLI